MPTLSLDTGAPAYCKGERCGTLWMVELSNTKHRITDLIIQLANPTTKSVVVPVALAESTNDEGVHLSITGDALAMYPEYEQENGKDPMSQTDFSFEFLSEIDQPDEPLRAEAERRLRELIDDHSDMIGASVAMEELTGAETPHRFQTRIVVYLRPSNVVAVEKAPDATTALQKALDTVERQIREQRERLREQSRRP